MQHILGWESLAKPKQKNTWRAQCFTPSVSTTLMQVLQYKTLLCLNGSPQQLFWASQPRPTQGLLSDNDHTTPVIQLHLWHQH